MILLYQLLELSGCAIFILSVVALVLGIIAVNSKQASEDEEYEREKQEFRDEEERAIFFEEKQNRKHY
jgi:hypothetical protein